MRARHARWLGLLAIGMSGLLVSTPVHAVPRPDGDTPTRRVPASAKIVPLSADLQISRTDGTAKGERTTTRETNRLYRDSAGRTRQEAGTTVTITDPVAKTTLRLDTRNHTVQRSPLDKPSLDPAAKAPATSSDKKIESVRRSLGTAWVQGVRAEGSAYTVTVPSLLSRPAQQKEVTIWSSSEVQLTVQTRVTDSSGYAYEQTYTNIRSGVEPAASLFKAPAGYREVDAATARAELAQEPCPLLNEPDPLVLESFFPFVRGQGVVNATTDPQIGCVFVDSIGISQPPLVLQPTTPLFLPFFQWFAFDDFGPVPFVPIVVFGDIAFAAFNGSDLTIKDSLVILNIIN